MKGSHNKGFFLNLYEIKICIVLSAEHKWKNNINFNLIKEL